MAGGNFDPAIGKVVPGTYMNFVSDSVQRPGVSPRGVAVIPIKSTYGPKGQFVELNSKTGDKMRDVLGFGLSDSNSNMLLVREALKNASTVKVYILNEGEKATASISENVTAAAVYGGTRGNDIKVVVTTNPVVTGTFNVSIYLGAVKVEEFEGVADTAAITQCASKFVVFSGEGTLAANAGVNLAGGTDGTSTVQELEEFLNALENCVFDTVAFPIASLTSNEYATLKSKIKYLRNELGKTGQFVVANFDGDYEGIINVTNGVILADGTELTATEVTAFVAGITAGAEYNESNTYKVYEGAIAVNGLKTYDAAETAIKNGELFFSLSSAGEVIITYDLNSLHSSYAMTGKSQSYKKNRFIRVIDALRNTLLIEFTPGKFDNSSEGWDLMQGIGYTILKTFESDGAIKNVNYENDFLIDRSMSTGDSTFINVAIQPVDSAEKIYITVKTS